MALLQVAASAAVLAWALRQEVGPVCAARPRSRPQAVKVVGNGSAVCGRTMQAVWGDRSLHCGVGFQSSFDSTAISGELPVAAHTCKERMASALCPPCPDVSLKARCKEGLVAFEQDSCSCAAVKSNWSYITQRMCGRYRLEHTFLL